MSSELVVIETSRFGRLEAESSDLVDFGGIPGFPRADRFVVMQHDSDSVFAWLISVEIPDLAFVVTEPWQFFPKYRPPLEARHLRSIGVESPEDFEIFCIVSFHEDKATLNLAAPILINVEGRKGVQLILDSGDYSVREEIPTPDPDADQQREKQTG